MTGVLSIHPLLSLYRSLVCGCSGLIVITMIIRWWAVKKGFLIGAGCFKRLRISHSEDGGNDKMATMDKDTRRKMEVARTTDLLDEKIFWGGRMFIDQEEVIVPHDPAALNKLWPIPEVGSTPSLGSSTMGKSFLPDQLWSN